jgi:hypothetical protein
MLLGYSASVLGSSAVDDGFRRMSPVVGPARASLLIRAPLSAVRSPLWEFADGGQWIAEAKGPRLILLAFFFPLAVYLLVLGFLNRQRHPLLVSGIWDGIGLIFGVSGFLLFAGPAVLSALSERWRLFWLLGKGDVPLAGPDGAWQFWIFLSILYFALIVGGAAFYFWRQRRLTAIYNADAEQIERALADVCDRLGVQPMRSGGLFLFGLSLGLTSERRGSNGERIQAPHYLPTAVRAAGSGAQKPAPSAAGTAATDRTILEQTAILEVERFPLLRHVTLRWDPVDSSLRQVVESELRRRLAETFVDDNPLGGWLLTLGSILLAFELAGAFFLIALHLFAR